MFWKFLIKLYLFNWWNPCLRLTHRSSWILKWLLQSPWQNLGLTECWGIAIISSKQHDKWFEWTEGPRRPEVANPATGKKRKEPIKLTHWDSSFNYGHWLTIDCKSQAFIKITSTRHNLHRNKQYQEFRRAGASLIKSWASNAFKVV